MPNTSAATREPRKRKKMKLFVYCVNPKSRFNMYWDSKDGAREKIESMGFQVSHVRKAPTKNGKAVRP